MEEIKMSESLQTAFFLMHNAVTESRVQFATPEHFLRALLKLSCFRNALSVWNADMEKIDSILGDWISDMERVPDYVDYSPEYSCQMAMLMNMALEHAGCSDLKEIGIPHYVNLLLKLNNSYACNVLLDVIDGEIGEFMNVLVQRCDENGDDSRENTLLEENGNNVREAAAEREERKEDWRQYVTCINEIADRRNPLIGREPELQRTIQVLCRKDKNNPLHVGEPGVGKTALVYGLARLINEGKVPERLQGSKIYGLDIATMLAGTQYRGDFEKRLKSIMDGIRKETSPIVYIDEIHNLVGAGAIGEGSMDASNMLKPYLETGDIRFIGSTTYEEYNRYFSKSKGLVRRFQQIDIAEPSQEETLEILRQLKGLYESYHNVSYTDEALRYAVEGSVRHICERFLPDKAIDLVDEAGAYREMNPVAGDDSPVVDRTLMTEVLSKACRVEVSDMEREDNTDLESLLDRIKMKVFGQDEAVVKVAESVLMARAGLTEDNKPMASLLFVGPTGVGKTEVARVLAGEMGVPLLRFDMSEYAEKHSVAKLIGSPAGYVGYEDGGILTDAVRKSPQCVLLLDEIEKAHPDIFDILLQVMDYARLTDNKGRHTDFRNVVLIMTSNAGAQYASRASVGFASKVSAGDAMLAHVKRLFKPEFLNRLTATVVFRDMTSDMASMILDKKLRALESLLSKRAVRVEISPELRGYILEKVFSKEYGARELDRVISSEVKPLLMREILFGSLKHGGVAGLFYENGKILLR